MLSVNSLLDNRYRIDRVLGSGGMGTVYLATDVSDHSVWAIKEQKVTAANRSRLLSEAEIMAKLEHPAFPRLRSYEERDGLLYIVMEYIEGDTLSQVLAKKERLTETEAVSVFRQVAEALEYLHNLEKPIIYRDFKVSNLILQKDGRVRIIDLGIAQEYNSDSGAKVNAVALTRGYAAPEQYDKRYKLDSRADIYALGVTMHYLVTGKNPNKPPYEFVPVRKLRRDVSRSLEGVIKKCLQPNPDQRYSNAGELLYDLNHLSDLEVGIRKQIRLRRILAGTVVLLVLVLSAAVYMINVNRQTARMNEYNTLLESARTAETLEEACNAAQAAIDKTPDNPEAYLLLAEKYAEFGEVEEAYDYINETIAPRFPDIYNNQDFLTLITTLELSY